MQRVAARGGVQCPERVDGSLDRRSVGHQGHEADGAEALLFNSVGGLAKAPEVLVDERLADGRHQDAAFGQLLEQLSLGR